MKYVIGVDGGSTECLVKARDMEGKILHQVRGKPTNHHNLAYAAVEARIQTLIEELLAGFGGEKVDCQCVVVGAAGVDSSADRRIVAGFYDGLGFPCKIFCMNDGSVALYATTRGVGTLAIAGTGSIAVGRNVRGQFTRSGGYTTTIFGDEGSSRWIALHALNYASQWVDQSVPDSRLTEMISDFFLGLDANKLVVYMNDIRLKPIAPELATMVYEAAKEGDEAALRILRNGAKELFRVSQTCVKKLGFDQQPSFRTGVWGSVFEKSYIFYHEYKRLFEEAYPGCEVVFPEGDAADGASMLALDYLLGKCGFIHELP